MYIKEKNVYTAFRKNNHLGSTELKSSSEGSGLLRAKTTEPAAAGHFTLTL